MLSNFQRVSSLSIAAKTPPTVSHSPEESRTGLRVKVEFANCTIFVTLESQYFTLAWKVSNIRNFCDPFPASRKICGIMKSFRMDVCSTSAPNILVNVTLWIGYLSQVESSPKVAGSLSDPGAAREEIMKLLYTLLTTTKPRIQAQSKTRIPPNNILSGSGWSNTVTKKWSTVSLNWRIFLASNFLNSPTTRTLWDKMTHQIVKS